MPTETRLNSQHPLLVNADVRFHHSLCWKAVFAGIVTVIGIHLLLMCLGAGIGLATFSPVQDQNATESFTIGAAIAWSVCALIALFVGGWVCGCFSAGPKTASLHGIIVWSATMAITFWLVTMGGGLALGGVIKTLGEGLGMTGKGLAMAGGDIGKTGLMQSSNQVSSFVEEAVKSSPTNAAPAATVRGQREMGLAVTRLFSAGNDLNSTSNQTSVIQALTNYAGLSEPDAKKMAADWMNSYTNLKSQLADAKTQAETKARAEADVAARHLSRAATVAFFAFLIGLIVTVCGTICGAKKTYRHTTLGVISE